MFSLCRLLKIRIEGHCIETIEWTGKKIEQDCGSCLSFYFYSLAFNVSILHFHLQKACANFHRVHLYEDHIDA